MCPPSANRIWKVFRGKNVLSREAKQYYDAAFVTWHEKVEWEFVDVEIGIVMTRRFGDVDNRIKPVLDALTHARVWPDDKCVASVSARLFAPNKRYPLGATLVQIRPALEKYGDFQCYINNYVNNLVCSPTVSNGASGEKAKATTRRDDTTTSTNATRKKRGDGAITE
jgi:Holliday junction resolvase